MLFVVRFISNIINNPYSINYQALAIDTKRKKRRRNIAAAALTKKAYYNLKTLKLDLVLTVPFSFVNLFIYLFIYLLKLYLLLVHKIALANKFQLYHKIKLNIICYMSPHMKHPQSISPMFLILFLNFIFNFIFHAGLYNSRKIIPYDKTTSINSIRTIVK